MVMKSENASSIARNLRWLLAAAILASAALLVVSATLQSFGSLRRQALLSLVGLAVGSFLARVLVEAYRGRSRFARAGLLSLGLSQLFYHSLIWAGWSTESLLWRAWWISFVVAASAAYVLALDAASSVRRDWLERGTRLCVLGLAILLIGLGLLGSFPYLPGPVYQILLGIFGAGSFLGSAGIWNRRRRARPLPAPMSGTSKLGWLAISHTVFLFTGWFLGRVALPTSTRFDELPAALASLSPEELDEQLAIDLERLKIVVEGVDELSQSYRELDSELRRNLHAEERDYYLPEEEDRIRGLFMSYLSYRSALLRMVATYVSFDSVRDQNARARCFTLGYAAAMTTFQASLELVHSYRDEIARLKLNEPEREWGIPAGMFDRIYEGVTNETNVELAVEMAAYFELEREGWREAGIWPSDDFDWLQGRIRRGFGYVQKHGLAGKGARLDLFFDRVRKTAYTPMYAAQSILAEWIGDTRIAQRPPLITTEKIEAIEGQLKPGDILLERRNWYLSNAFLPGFWPHAALYVGRVDDLRSLQIAEDPTIQAQLKRYLEAAPDGRDHTVIESVSEGVIFSSLTESMHADYVAVLRPRLSEDQVGRAIARAFRHHGKPYDFEFDFFTSDKLVCTELVYRAYEGMLHFDLVKVMGRDTLPALELVRKYARERGRPDQELDFVLFLDGEPASLAVKEATEDDFLASADRSSTFSQ
jgi:hypothetical protein